MIPLSNWLSAGDRAGVQMALADVASPCTCSAEDEQARAAAVEDALLRGRLEGASAAGEAWERKLADLQDAHAATLDAIRAEADSRLSAAIADSISEAVSGLRMSIETAVASALRPFLSQQAVQAAAAELLRLMDEDLQQHASPSLEVRAPAALHDALRALLAEKSIACVLTEADDIRLVSAHGSLRYESLAADWIKSLEGMAP